MSAPLSEKQIYAALNQVMDPELNHSLVELGLIEEVEIVDGHVHIEMHLTTPHCPFAERIVQSVRDAVLALDGVEEVEVERSCMREE